MPKRFTLPTATRRQTSTAMVILVLVLAVVYLAQFRLAAPPSPWAASLQSFRNDCMKAARHANGGGDLVMDDATEAKIGAYCGCMAEAIQSNVAPPEIEKIGRGQAGEKTIELLSRIAEGCKPQLE